MTHPYGIPYTVNGWGDEVVTTATICGCVDEPAPEGYLHVTRAGGGPVILVPTAALTPVDTTPAEPEPGVYFIGDDGEAWQHFEDRADEQRWCVVGYAPILTWRQVWAKVGGPGVTIRRLIPEPAPVELPWERRVGGRTVAVRADDDPEVSPGAAFLECGAPDDGCMEVWLSSADLEATAAALLTAARAAREATR